MNDNCDTKDNDEKLSTEITSNHPINDNLKNIENSETDEVRFFFKIFLFHSVFFYLVEL